jgi:hypothetical protein
LIKSEIRADFNPDWMMIDHEAPVWRRVSADAQKAQSVGHLAFVSETSVTS